jgi:ABC transporter ATM
MLIRRPDVLILDEPTAALDTQTSSRLARQMVEYARKYAMMLIIVSHKPDFDRHATKIVQIPSGPEEAGVAL